MFERAVQTALAYGWHSGWIYRCEYLNKPHHNALTYAQVPEEHIIIYDIETGLQKYLTYEEVAAEAHRLGLDVVPRLFEGKVDTLQQLKALLDTESILGGCKIEGMVIKNYERFGKDGKVFMGKLVAEDFKEVHAKEWKKANPGGKDIVGLLTEELRTEARWRKAVQHRAEAGKLLNAPQDIGPLLKLIAKDVEEEEGDRIKAVLFKWAWKHIQRGITRGFPQWYKQQLAEQEIGDGPKGATDVKDEEC